MAGKNVTSSQQNVMPAFGEVQDVAMNIDDIYAYLKARCRWCSWSRSSRKAIGTRGATVISERAKIGILVLALLAGPLPAAAQGSISGELVDRTELRVCADPASLPFSNSRAKATRTR